jgi:hypothetical protein
VHVPLTSRIPPKIFGWRKPNSKVISALWENPNRKVFSGAPLAWQAVENFDEQLLAPPDSGSRIPRVVSYHEYPPK